MARGTIPSELGLLTGLTTVLDIQDNQFSGLIPTELGLLTKLPELDMNNNKLTGPIPSEFGQLTSMGRLSFASNFLSGMVPRELSFLHLSLHTLMLDGNPNLSGTVPAELCLLNGTCLDSILLPCREPFGLSFDCSTLICGCECSC